MKDRCIKAVSEALGRDITKEEAQGIENRILAARRGLARMDRIACQSMSSEEQLRAASKMSGQLRKPIKNIDDKILAQNTRI